MARSFKKHFHTGYACDSDKAGKKAYSKKFRRIEKQKIKAGNFVDIPVRVREIYDVWDMPKDGKCYFGRWRYSEKNYEYFVQAKRK